MNRYSWSYNDETLTLHGHFGPFVLPVARVSGGNWHVSSPVGRAQPVIASGVCFSVEQGATLVQLVLMGYGDDEVPAWEPEPATTEEPEPDPGEPEPEPECGGPWIPFGDTRTVGLLTCEVHGIDCPAPEIRDQWIKLPSEDLLLHLEALHPDHRVYLQQNREIPSAVMRAERALALLNNRSVDLGTLSLYAENHDHDHTCPPLRPLKGDEAHGPVLVSSNPIDPLFPHFCKRRGTRRPGEYNLNTETGERLPFAGSPR